LVDLPGVISSEAVSPRRFVLRSKFNVKGKRYVRDHLWIPIFEKVLAEKHSQPEKIRYLCLPGPECFYIRQLLGRKLISQKTYVVAIESNDEYHKMALQFCSKNLLKGNHEVLFGKFEDLCTKPILKSKFPFDVMELDLPEPFFSVRPDRQTQFLAAIERCLIAQAHYEKPCYLITTFKSGGTLPRGFLSSYNDISDYLVKEILERENSRLGSAPLKGILGMNPKDPSFEALCCLYAIPLIIIRRTSGFSNVSLLDVPYTYVSSAGSLVRLLCFAFHCIPREGGVVGHQDPTDGCLRDAVERVAKTVWYESRK